MNTCPYNNCSSIYSLGNISSNAISSTMLSTLIDRCGYKVNQDLGADGDGSDYVSFQTSDSGGQSYVDTNTYNLIIRAHQALVQAYALTSATPSPDLDLYTEVDQELVKYRQDFKDEAKAKFFYKEYERLVELLMETDAPDGYFGRRRYDGHSVVISEPSYDIEPRGNPL